MSKIIDTTTEGFAVDFRKSELERAMRIYLTLRHTMDESQRKKRKSGYYIYAKHSDYWNLPILPYIFKRETDAKFIIKVLNAKIPRTAQLNLYIRKLFSRRFQSIEEDKTIHTTLPETTYEVETLDRDARIKIWKQFVV
jgi:hypothetical protein